MKTLNNKILELPTDQQLWLLTIKTIFKPTIHFGSLSTKDLLEAFTAKANEKGYSDIISLINHYDFEKYFKN